MEYWPEKPDEWGEDQKRLTREYLTDVPLAPFRIQLGRPNKGCSLDHLDGRFGYISEADARNKRWRVFDYDSDELQGEYESLDDLIEGGWKVST